MIKVKEVSELVLKPGDIIYDCHPGKHPDLATGFEVESIDTKENRLYFKALGKNRKGYFSDDITGLFHFHLTESHCWFLLDLVID